MILDRMKQTRLAEIEAELVRLQEGNLTEPVKIQGMGVYRAIRKRLETLRLSLLKLTDTEVDIERRVNNSIAAVAHDMKTPLAIIRGYAECISDGMDDKDYASLIIQRTEQMNDMVISLIEDSHKAIEKNSEQKSLQNSRIYFSEVVSRLRPLAVANGMQLKVNKIPEANIRINSKQFGRVIMNLFSNAVKYSTSGSEIKITFRLWAKSLFISVKDKGKGISKESLPYIFDQFYKEDSTRPTSQSSGLGLYIVKEIVRDHGGNVFVTSKKDKGSVFTVSIPVEPNFDDKLTPTARFDKLRLWEKLLFELVFGWIMASLYRLVRFFETRNMSTLIFAALCLALFPFVWMIDFLSIIVYGRITFLAD